MGERGRTEKLGARAGRGRAGGREGQRERGMERARERAKRGGGTGITGDETDGGSQMDREERWGEIKRE